MFEDITIIDLKLLSLFIQDYSKKFSINEMSKKLKINYSHTFKRVKKLVKIGVLNQSRFGKSNVISFNINNIYGIQILSYAEEMDSKKIKNLLFQDIIKSVVIIDPFSCIGLFGSRVSLKSKEDSDWDIFIITNKRKEIEKIKSKFPFARDVDISIFSLEEFEESMESGEETVVKHIIKNKHILYNPHPFYNLIMKLEGIKYAPTQ